MRERSGIDRAARIDQAAGELIADRHIGPRARCFVCGRGPTDPVSIRYGTDQKCWRDVLAIVHDVEMKENPQ